MRMTILIGWVGLCLTACTYLIDGPYPEVVETESQLVTDCTMLGVIAETADAGQPISILATRGMVNRVKERAAQLGADHIVWLHKTDISAAAEAYRCSPQ